MNYIYNKKRKCYQSQRFPCASLEIRLVHRKSDVIFCYTKAQLLKCLWFLNLKIILKVYGPGLAKFFIVSSLCLHLNNGRNTFLHLDGGGRSLSLSLFLILELQSFLSCFFSVDHSSLIKHK